MIVSTTARREMIHWVALWILAALAVSVMQVVLAGQTGDARPDQGSGIPIPMPNIDRPDWFRYPSLSPGPAQEAATLTELLEFQRAGDFKKSLRGWMQVRIASNSETWRSVGMGVALLRLDRLDEAIEHLERAVEQDPNNAVAEYFVARVRQAQGRQIPFWYEPDQSAPFRLAIVVQPAAAPSLTSFEQQGKTRPRRLLPHFIDDAYIRLAKRHFRRAVTLAPKCDLNQVIEVVIEQPSVIQLANQRNDRSEIERKRLVTVGDLLDSLGERDYVRKSIAELGAPPS